MARLSFGAPDVATYQPLDAVSADAQARERFHQVNACRVEFPRVQYVRGRGRVLFLSAIGHEVVFHGSQFAVSPSSAPVTPQAKA
jgi:hypothetical protein